MHTNPDNHFVRLPDVLLALYFLVCLGCLVWPGYALLGNRIEPIILGLPFVFFWVIGWVLATFLAMALYHLACDRREEPAEPE